jgi:hypothetical protein
MQATAMVHLSPAFPQYDPSRADEMVKLLALVDDAIRFLQAQYRAECGADDTCTVGLTYDAVARFPIVDGRPSDGSVYIHEKLSTPVWS